MSEILKQYDKPEQWDEDLGKIQTEILSSWRHLLLAGWAIVSVLAAIPAQAQPCDRSGCGSCFLFL